MTQGVVTHTRETDAKAAGAALGNDVLEQFQGEPPDVVIVFASSGYDATELLATIQSAATPKVLLGCTSAGEFANQAMGAASASAVGIRSSDIRFTPALGRGLRADREAAAKELVSNFSGTIDSSFRYRTAMILTDALAGHVDDFIEQLTLLTRGEYQFFGGGAGDDAQFRKTTVFFGTEVYEDAVVGLEILSNKPVGIGVQHGWQPSSPPMRVTEATDMTLSSLNATVALDVFKEHAKETGQSLEATDPLPFFLHNVLGIRGAGDYQLRVPLAVNEDGSVLCAADIPTGATAAIMGTTSASAAEAAFIAAENAVSQLNGHKPSVALFFDCVATRLRTGRGFEIELDSVQRALGGASFAGFNSYGQVARAEGQFSGFHNCTAVVCVLPE